MKAFAFLLFTYVAFAQQPAQPVIPSTGFPGSITTVPRGLPFTPMTMDNLPDIATLTPD